MNCDVEAYEPVEEQGIRGFIVTCMHNHLQSSLHV